MTTTATATRTTRGRRAAEPMSGPAGALLSTRDLMERLAVSRSTVHRLIAGGDLPTVRADGLGVRVRVGDLDAWIARHVR